MSVVTIRSNNRSDGTSASVSISAPVSREYTGTFASNQCVIDVPDADLAADTDGVTQATWFVPGATPSTGAFTIRAGSQVGVDEFDVPAAEASFRAVRVSDNVQVPRSQLEPGVQYKIFADLPYGDGSYAGAGNTRNMDVDVGSEVFVGRVGATVTNEYLYTPPNFSSTDQSVEFTWGKRNDAGDVIALATVTATLLQKDAPVTQQLANVVDLNAIGLKSFGQFDQADWEAIFGSNAAFTPGRMQHLSLIDDNGVRKIRQQHIAAGNGSDRVFAPFNIPERDTIEIIQTIELDSNYTFGTSEFSGKLGFGFGGGANTSGGNSNPSGFTCRPSWDDNGEFGIYSYAANRDNGGNSSFGEEIHTGFFMTPGQAFTVRMLATINSSFGASDGTLKVWVNGIQRLDLTGIGWQTQSFSGESKPHFDRIWYSQFHGGAGPEWAPNPSPTHSNTYDVSWQ